MQPLYHAKELIEIQDAFFGLIKAVDQLGYLVESWILEAERANIDEVNDKQVSAFISVNVLNHGFVEFS